MKDPIQYPNIDSAACVLTMTPMAQCSACVDICPRNALCLDDDSLGVDEDACDGCGLCHAACPEGAIDIPMNLELRENLQDGTTAFLACAYAGIEHQDGIVPCLHAVGMRDLQRLGEQGIAQLAIASGECQTCPRNSDQSFDRSVKDFNAIQGSRESAIMRVQRLSVETWRREINARRKYATSVDQGRRQFLSLFIGRREIRAEPLRRSSSEMRATAPWIYAAVPEIDGTKCNGCDACMRICPHGVFELSDNGAAIEYRIQPAQCTGCQLCKDVCDQGAVMLQTMITQRQGSVPLKKGRCRICGVHFHVPEEAKIGLDVCPICARTGRHQDLFQVHD